MEFANALGGRMTFVPRQRELSRTAARTVFDTVCTSPKTAGLAVGLYVCALTKQLPHQSSLMDFDNHTYHFVSL